MIHSVEENAAFIRYFGISLILFALILPPEHGESHLGWIGIGILCLIWSQIMFVLINTELEWENLDRPIKITLFVMAVPGEIGIICAMVFLIGVYWLFAAIFVFIFLYFVMKFFNELFKS